MSFSDLERSHPPMFASSGFDESSGSRRGEQPTFADRLLAFLDQIRATDKMMDEARVAKIGKIKKALAAGTYNVSAAEVAQKIIDQLDEP
jgi:anti-sigma28 factor (negative regulator of flagellin synthesis)